MHERRRTAALILTERRVKCLSLLLTSYPVLPKSLCWSQPKSQGSARHSTEQARAMARGKCPSKDNGLLQTPVGGRKMRWVAQNMGFGATNTWSRSVSTTGWLY